MWPEVLSFGDAGFGDEILFLGAPLTFGVALASLLWGLLLGLLNASMALSRSRALNLIADVYTTIIRGIPEFLVVMIIFYGSGILLEEIARSVFDYQEEVPINKFIAGAFALGLIFGAYGGEVFRGAFLAVPKGQIEAGFACGMSKQQVFFRIRMPQMWRFALPGLGNLWMVLLKDTSLVSVIALDETLRWSKVAAERSQEPFTCFLYATAIYLVLTIVSDVFRQRLEKHVSRGVRTA
ncbi:MAG: ABC transporter permease subunit [Alphaproteobacteria bacterium]|nr:ABC transporter permease subunit [Alphaproteobacteria bacterium]